MAEQIRHCRHGVDTRGFCEDCVSSDGVCLECLNDPCICRLKPGDGDCDNEG